MDRVIRAGKVYYDNRFAGLIKQTAGGYVFIYDAEYVSQGPPLSFNLPLQMQPFKSTTLFSFFENLASEGWLRKIQAQTQKIDVQDTFGLILKNGQDMAGAVTILRDSVEVLQS